MKNCLIILVTILFLGSFNAKGQIPATRSGVIGIGQASCAGGTIGLQNFNYNAGTNFLSQTGLICTPNLAAPGFSNSRAIIDYNPKDQMVYYFRRVLVSGTIYNTYVWRWAPGTCPPAGPGLVAIDTFFNEYLTVAFDAAGNGWMIKFGPTAPYSLTMRKVDFTTGTIGVPVNINLPPGVNLYTQSGDYLITPGGNLFFAYNNKLLTVNYQDYGVLPLNATYIDTIKLPSPGQNLIGLAYADGEFVGSFYKGGTCGYAEVDILTGNQTVVTRPGGQTFTSFDNCSVTGGVGISKRLVSVTPNGPPGRYTVSYDIYVKNYGNYPVGSVQVIDSLQFINGLANVVPGSVSSAFIDNPGSLVRNAAYNGTTIATLLNPGQTLVNTPLTNNHFTIRVTADITGIVPGIIYYNSAVATGTFIGGLPLRDSSTNGTSPDLNLNEKPDDAGESIKTPFVITVAGQANACSNLETVLHSQNFNTASDQATMPVGGTSAYAGSLTIPLPEERFVITNNALTRYPAYWNSLTDHGGGGRMMVVNADISNSVIYSATVSGLCSNLRYSFSGWVANISNPSQVSFCNAVGGVKYPKLNFRVKDAVSGAILSSISTGNLTSSSWTEQGMRFVLPAAYANVIIEIINEGEGGCGNDLALDDIRFGLCDADPVVSLNHINAGCLGTSASFTAVLADPSAISGTPDYQWQSSPDGVTWTNIAAAPNNATYTIASVVAGDVNKYYRAIVAATGNLLNVSCRYMSPSFFLVAGCDIDDDDDGIPDAMESGGLDPLDDDDMDGIPNYRDVNYPGYIDVNTDGVNDNFDYDRDGIINELDLDSDNDGVPDVIEAGGVDANGDGKIDNYLDTDNDGFSQNVDANSSGKNASGNGLALPDFDGDGIPNYFDLDSDNDGIPDVIEALGNDSNNDGLIDGYVDSDADGFSDNVDSDLGNDGTAENMAISLLRSGADINADGRADSYPFKNMDNTSRPNAYDLDSDMDGITDVIEAGFADADFNGFADGPLGADGWNAALNALLSLNIRNTDGRSGPNYLDIDSDDDGIPDNVEGMTTIGYQFPTYLDTDNDGIDNRYDNIVGVGGTGIFVADKDSDGIPDYLDLDTDADGLPDIVEGNDFNLNGVADDNVTLTLLDTDGDGLDNRFDSLNSVTNIKGTSYRMGTGGSLIGDPTPGTRSPVQKYTIAQPERDWRYVTYVLPLQLFQLTGAQNANIVSLNWSIISSQPLDKFEIQRSVNNITFDKISTIDAAVNINELKNFTGTDDIISINSQVIFYRLKVIAANGQEKFSEVLVIKKGNAKMQMNIHPNPAKDNATVSFYSEKETMVTFAIKDYTGKQVMVLNQKVVKGNNSIVITGLSKLPDGVYNLQVIINNDMKTQKLLIFN